MKRRRWNWDYARRYREMARWVEEWRQHGVMFSAQWHLDAQDEVRSEFRYHALPIGVIARMNRRELEHQILS